MYTSYIDWRGHDNFYALNIGNLLSIVDSSLLPKSFERIIVKGSWIKYDGSLKGKGKYTYSNLSIDVKSKENELMVSVLK